MSGPAHKLPTDARVEELPPDAVVESLDDAPATPPGQRTSGAQAFGLGAADTASYGFSDEAAGLGSWLASKMDGGDIPRAASRGVDAPVRDVTDYESGRDELRADQDAAKDEHKLAYRGGQAVGIGGTLMAPLPGSARLAKFAKPAGGKVAEWLLAHGASEGVAKATGNVAGRAAVAAPTGAVLGGVNAAGDSEASLMRDPGQLAKDTAVGVGAGAVAGPIVGEGVHQAAKIPGAVASGMSSAAKWAADHAGEAADKFRFGATGVYPHQLDALSKEKGPEYIRELGQAAEKMKGEHGLGWASPWNARAYRDAADTTAAAAGKRIGENLSAADASGVRVPTDPVADALDAQAGTYGGRLGTNPGDKQANALASEAARWRTRQPDSMAMGNEGVDPTTLEPRFEAPAAPRSLSPSETMGMKKEYEGLGGYTGEKIATLPHGSTPEMYQDAANPVRTALYSAMDGAPGDAGPRFRSDMNEYGKANTILNAADKRVMHDDANQIVSLPSAVLASGGLVAGHGAGAAAAGAGMGLVKGYGKDVVATGMRAAEKTALATQSASEGIGDWLKSAASSEAGQKFGEGVRQQLPARGAEAVTHGSSVDAAVMQMAQENPDQLGEYGPELAQAAQESPEHFAAVQQRLSETRPEFNQMLRAIHGSRVEKGNDR